MKASEKPAYKYLTFLDLGEVVYEPDGNVAPDFLLGDRIAVEVRRLNLNYPNKRGYNGLEEVSIPLRDRLSNLLTEFGVAVPGKPSWFVGFTFRRPVPLKQLLNALREYLEGFMSGLHQITECNILPTFQISLHPASTAHKSFFVLGGYFDQNAVSFVIPALRDNLVLCSNENAAKIASRKHLYDEWWLVLIDRIYDGYDQQVSIRHPWSKLIVVSPNDPKRFYEVPSY